MPCATSTKLLAVVSESGLARLLQMVNKESDLEEIEELRGVPDDSLDDLGKLRFWCYLAISELYEAFKSWGRKIRR